MTECCLENAKTVTVCRQIAHGIVAAIPFYRRTDGPAGELATRLQRLRAAKMEQPWSC